MPTTALKRSRRSSPPVVEARRAAFPGFIRPCDPTLAESPPAGAQWLHEIKIDGYRVQLHIRGGKVTVYSRNGYDWSKEFEPIVRAASTLGEHDLVIDGEATVLGATGVPDFQALRREL